MEIDIHGLNIIILSFELRRQANKINCKLQNIFSQILSRENFYPIKNSKFMKEICFKRSNR